MLGFIFIGGWGNVKKRYVGTVGAHRCPTCAQIAEWKIYDIEKRATVFFVPVLKYSSTRVVICTNCEAGAEVDAAAITNLRQHPEVGVRSTPVPIQGPDAAEEKRYQAASRRSDRELVKDGGMLAKLRSQRMRRGHPELVQWANVLTQTLTSYGYVPEDEVKFGEKWRGVCPQVLAQFRYETAVYSVVVCQTLREALLYASALVNDAVFKRGMNMGLGTVKTMDRRVFIGMDERGMNAERLGYWTAAVSSVPLPR